MGVVSSLSTGDRARDAELRNAYHGVGGSLGLGRDSTILSVLKKGGYIKQLLYGLNLGATIFFTDSENAAKYPERLISLSGVGQGQTSVSGSFTLGKVDESKLSGKDGNDLIQTTLNSKGEVELTIYSLVSSWFDGVGRSTLSSTNEFRVPSPAGIRAVVDYSTPYIHLPRSLWDQMDPVWNRGDLNATTGRTYYTDRTAYRDWRNFTFQVAGASTSAARVNLTLQHFDWNIWDEAVGFWAPAFKIFGRGAEEKIVLGRAALGAMYVAVNWDDNNARAASLGRRS